MTRTGASPADRRRRAFRVAAAVLSSALAAGGCEAILAAAGWPDPADFALDDVSDKAEFIAKSAYDVDPVLLWRMHRDATLDVPELAFKSVHTDKRGLRGRDRDDERAKSRLRVICLGDSVTFGLTLADDDTYPSQLERRLRGRTPPDVAPVVLNAGIPGHSSVQGMRLLDELAPLAPDVVVWWFGMNDSKPALGDPDAKLRISDGRVDGGPIAFLRRLRTVRAAPSSATDCAAGRRASPTSRRARWSTTSPRARRPAVRRR